MYGLRRNPQRGCYASARLRNRTAEEPCRSPLRRSLNTYRRSSRYTRRRHRLAKAGRRRARCTPARVGASHGARSCVGAHGLCALLCIGRRPAEKEDMTAYAGTRALASDLSHSHSRGNLRSSGSARVSCPERSPYHLPSGRRPPACGTLPRYCHKRLC